MPAAALEGFGKRIGKDSYVFAASVWIRKNRPEAIVAGMECWAVRLSDEARGRLMREEGETPDMMVRENRERLEQKYGGSCRQCLILQGELLGLPKTVYRSVDITGGTVGRPQQVDGFRSRYEGLLAGKVWTPSDDAGFK